MKTLVVSHLSKYYADQTIFHDVSFSFPNHGFFGIVGPSGSGKSTFLELLSGIQNDYLGDIFVLGTAMKRLTSAERATFRLRNIGFIRQDYDLLESETVRFNALLPTFSFKSNEWLNQEWAKDLLRYFGLTPWIGENVNCLSGGEKQRVAFARALINNPPIILADEPTAALDASNADSLLTALKKLSKKHLVICVSHDLKRMRRYSDEILFLERQSFREERLAKEESLSPCLSPNLPVAVPRRSLILKWLCHARHLLRTKKWRASLVVAALCFSLFSLGLSQYAHHDLASRLDHAFQSLTGEETIVVSSGASSSTRVIATPEENVASLARHYPTLIKDYGVSYFSPFEDFFPDKNQATYEVQGFRKIIPSFTVRSVNDYLWLDDVTSKTFFPSLPPLLEPEQIVLGLPYSVMVKMCLSLHLLRNYESLGEYLDYCPIPITLEMANRSWQYQDEQLLSLVAVTESQELTIYHYDHRWSEWLLQEKMRFPSSDEIDHSFPWILHKIFYIEPKENAFAFMQEARKSEELARYVFERPSYECDRTHNRKAERSLLNRLYVYTSDHHYFAPSVFTSFSASPAIYSASLLGEESYVAYPEGLAVGFAHPFFAGEEELEVELAADVMQRMPLGKGFLPQNIPHNVVMGTYLKPPSDSLTFSSDFRQLEKGRKPVNSEEICLSASLYRTLSCPKKIFLSGATSYHEREGENYLDYQIASAKVVGVTSEERPVIYGVPSWCIDFWRDELGMSSFLLEPTQAILYLKEPSRGEEVRAKLAAHYSNLHFYDTAASIRHSLIDTTRYVEIALNVFSIGAALANFILLIVVSLLLAINQKKETKMLFLLGFRNDDILDCFGSVLFLLIGIATIFAFFSLLFSENAVDTAICKNFGTQSSLNFSTTGFLAIILGSFGSLFVSLLFMKAFLARKDIFKRGS